MLLESLRFLAATAKALVDKQLLNRWAMLWELDDDAVDNLFKMVRKPGGGEEGHQIPKMAMTDYSCSYFMQSISIVHNEKRTSLVQP